MQRWGPWGFFLLVAIGLWVLQIGLEWYKPSLQLGFYWFNNVLDNVLVHVRTLFSKSKESPEESPWIEGDLDFKSLHEVKGVADLYESFLYVTIYNGSDWTIEKMKIKLNLFYKDGTSDERVYAIHFLLPVEPLSNGSAREKVLLPGESERISRWTWEILTAYGRKRRDTLRMLP